MLLLNEKNQFLSILQCRQIVQETVREQLTFLFEFSLVLDTPLVDISSLEATTGGMSFFYILF